MTSYRIPCGKYKDRAIDNLSDNILCGLLWAYRPDGLNNEELHGECYAVLYSRYGSAVTITGMVDGFVEWTKKSPAERGSSKGKKGKSKKKKQMPVPTGKAFTMKNGQVIYLPDDVEISPDDTEAPF